MFDVKQRAVEPVLAVSVGLVASLLTFTPNRQKVRCVINLRELLPRQH
jgi:hypothetical protein